MQLLTRSITILWFLTGPTTAGAQALPPLKPGVPVRLVARTAAGPRPFAGSLLLLDLDSVTIVRPHTVSPVSFSLRSLDRFEVNRGQPRALLYGGPLYGAALGTLFGATALRPDARCLVLPNDQDCRWETSEIIVGAAGGAVLFAVLVRILVPEVWQQLPLRELVADPDPESLRLGLRIRLSSGRHPGGHEP